MAKQQVDWYYHRKSWTGCTRSDAFLEGRGLTVRETVDARKQRYREGDLKRLFKGARKILVARGKKSALFDVRKDGLPPVADLAKVALGPSGNLRAPTLRLGDDWIVGFGREPWDEYFG